MEELNICLVSLEFPPMIGGEGKYTFTLANALSDLGNNVTVITADINRWTECIEGHRFELVTLPIRKFGIKSFSFNKQVNKKLKEIYNNRDVDILHCANDVMRLSISKRDVNLPLITTVHHPWAAEREFYRSKANLFNYLKYAYGKKIYYLEWLEKKICNDSDKIIAVSNYTANSIIDEYQISPDKITVIPNSVDTQRFNPDVNGHEIREKLNLLSEPIILYVGKLDYHKGVEYLIRGFARVVIEFPDVKLVIVGDGPIRKNIEYLTNVHKLGESVIFVGRVTDDDLPKYYAASDLLILPSLMEGFGIVLLEAMASGKPCIAARAGGTEDAIIDNETGFLVTPADSNSLYQAICVLLLNNDILKKFGKAGRIRAVQNFTPTKIAEQTINLYKEVL